MAFGSIQMAHAAESVLTDFMAMESGPKGQKLREKRLKGLLKRSVSADCQWQLSVVVRPGEVIGHEYLVISRQQQNSAGETAAEILVADLVPVDKRITAREVLDYLYTGAEVPAKIRMSWGKDAIKLAEIITRNLDSAWTIYQAPQDFSTTTIEELKGRIELSAATGQIYHSRAIPGTHNCETWLEAMVEPMAKVTCFGFTELLRELYDIADLE